MVSLLNNIKIREANLIDCRDLWKWRNNREVRKACFNTSVVSFSKHREWFFLKLEDANAKIYIAYNRKSEEKLGVIRFEQKNDKTEISMNLNPRFIGKGIGSHIIEIATEKYISEICNTPIFAEIRNDNIRSQKAFKQAGYIFEKHTIKNKKKASLFRYQIKKDSNIIKNFSDDILHSLTKKVRLGE